MKTNLATTTLALSAITACLLAVSSARAVTFGATGTNSTTGRFLSATAQFATNAADTQLIITLSNLGAPISDPSDVLGCVFFNLTGVGTLTPLSAVLGPGSGLTNGPPPAGTTLGDQWDYEGGLPSNTPNGASRGISSTGLSWFGQGDFGSNPQNVDGVAYGIINGSPAGGNDHLPTDAFENNSMVFTLSGLPVGFNLSDVSNVGFQYGTSTGGGEPFLPAHPVPEPVPEPSAWTMLVLGAGLLVFFQRRG